MARKKVAQVRTNIQPVRLEDLTPEKIAAEFDTPEKLQALLRVTKGLVARTNDDPDGFAAFYELVFGNKLPAHCRAWIEHIYAAKQEDKGALIWAWRGSWKSTTLTVGFTAFRIGHNPERANLIIRSNDDSAEKSATAIADIIAMNGGWKECFPHIVPDMEKGWSTAGYQVKRADIEYEEWRNQNAARTDPTLMGLGYNSASLIGKHPDGVLDIDDINDEKNTASAKERLTVNKLVAETILPLVVEDETRQPGQRLVTWEFAVCTPWTEDDASHYLRNTGEFKFLCLPVMRRAEPNEPGAVEIGQRDMTFADHVDIFGWWHLEWPERFSVRIIVSWRNKAAKRGFARMYLLDLSSSNETGIKYQLYPHELINPRWVAYGGCDYASVIAPSRVENKERDFFALAIGLEIPTGGAVIAGGVFEQCTQAAAEAHIEAAQNLWPNYRYTVVEGDGKGEEFITVMRRHPHMRLMPMKTAGRGKKERLERQMGPWTEIGMLTVSDDDTPFLNALRKCLDEYPNWHLDPADGMYWVMRAMPHVFVIKQDEERQPTPAELRQKKVKRESAWSILANAD